MYNVGPTSILPAGLRWHNVAGITLIQRWANNGPTFDQPLIPTSYGRWPNVCPTNHFDVILTLAQRWTNHTNVLPTFAQPLTNILPTFTQPSTCTVKKKISIVLYYGKYVTPGLSASFCSPINLYLYYTYQSYETCPYTLIDLIVIDTSLLYKHIPKDITF